MTPVAPLRGIPFWFWLIVLAVIVLGWWGYGELREHRARQRLRATLEQYQREGVPIFPEEMFVRRPGLNATRQERAKRWAEQLHKELSHDLEQIEKCEYDTNSPDGVIYPFYNQLDSWIDGVTDDAPAWRELAQRGQKVLAEWDAIHRDGPVSLDEAGTWIQQTDPVPRYRGSAQKAFMGEGEVRFYLLIRAHAFFADRTAALTHVDAFHAASRDTIDHRLYTSISMLAGSGWSLPGTYRDRLYLDLERMNLLPSEAREQWLAESPDFFTETADAMRTRQALWFGWVNRDVLEHDKVTFYKDANLPLPWGFFGQMAAQFPASIAHICKPLTDFLDRPYLPYEAEKYRIWVEVEHVMDIALRHGYILEIPTLSMQTGEVMLGVTVAGSSMPSTPPPPTYRDRITYPLIRATQANAEAVRMRLAVRILADARLHSLPADEAELCQRFGIACLDVHRGPRQAYERIDAKRFRLYSTTRDLPTWFDAKRITAPKPTPKDRHCVFESWSCEIELRTPPSPPSTP